MSENPILRKIEDDNRKETAEIRRDSLAAQELQRMDSLNKARDNSRSTRDTQIINTIGAFQEDQEIINIIKGSTTDCISYHLRFTPSSKKRSPNSLLLGNLFKHNKYAQITLRFKTVRQQSAQFKFKWSFNPDSCFRQLNDTIIDNWNDPDVGPATFVKFAMDICKRSPHRMRFSYFLEAPLDSNRREAMDAAILYKHMIQEDTLFTITINNLAATEDNELNAIADSIRQNLREGIGLSFDFDKTLGRSLYTTLEPIPSSVRPGEIIIYFKTSGKARIIDRSKDRKLFY